MRNFSFIILALIAITVSCKKTDDLPEARLFRPVLKEQLFSDGNWIDVKWQQIGSAVSYTVEISKDTFQTILNSVTVDTNYYRFENLEWNRRYQIQVRANAADTSFNSKFSNLGEVKTAIFPTILNTPGVSDVTDKAVRVSWTTGGAPVTDIRIIKTSDSSTVAQVALTASDVTNMYRIVSGLQPSTGYTVYLYSGTAVRGWADFNTKATLVGNIIDLRGITGQPSVLADTLAIIPSGSIVLLDRNETYNISSQTYLSKSVTIMSGADLNTTNRASIYFTSNFNFQGGSVIDSIVFNDVYMRSDNYSSRYVFNTNQGATVGSMKFLNCHAEIFRGLVRIQSGATTVSNFVINNCILDSLANYGVLTVDNVSCKVENVSITNSTIYKTEKVFTSRQNSESVLFENLTFNESPAGNSSSYYIDFSTGSSNNVTNGVTVNNCIFGIGKNSGGNFTVRDIRVGSSTTINASNNYRTSDHLSAGNDLPNIIIYSRPSNELWENPASGNFQIVDNLFPGRSNSGDPRWRL